MNDNSKAFEEFEAEIDTLISESRETLKVLSIDHKTKDLETAVSYIAKCIDHLAPWFDFSENLDPKTIQMTSEVVKNVCLSLKHSLENIKIELERLKNEAEK